MVEALRCSDRLEYCPYHNFATLSGYVRRLGFMLNQTKLAAYNLGHAYLRSSFLQHWLHSLEIQAGTNVLESRVTDQKQECFPFLDPPGALQPQKRGPLWRTPKYPLVLSQRPPSMASSSVTVRLTVTDRRKEVSAVTSTWILCSIGRRTQATGKKLSRR